MEFLNVALYIFFIITIGILAIGSTYFVTYFTHDKERTYPYQNVFHIILIVNYVIPFIYIIMPLFEFTYEKINQKTPGVLEVD